MSIFPGLHPSLHVRVVLFAGAKFTCQCLLCMGLDPHAAVSGDGVHHKNLRAPFLKTLRHFIIGGKLLRKTLLFWIFGAASFKNKLTKISFSPPGEKNFTISSSPIDNSAIPGNFMAHQYFVDAP